MKENKWCLWAKILIQINFNGIADSMEVEVGFFRTYALVHSWMVYWNLIPNSIFDFNPIITFWACVVCVRLHNFKRKAIINIWSLKLIESDPFHSKIESNSPIYTSIYGLEIAVCAHAHARTQLILCIEITSAATEN